MLNQCKQCMLKIVCKAQQISYQDPGKPLGKVFDDHACFKVSQSSVQDDGHWGWSISSETPKNVGKNHMTGIDYGAYKEILVKEISHNTLYVYHVLFISIH